MGLQKNHKKASKMTNANQKEVAPKIKLSGSPPPLVKKKGQRGSSFWTANKRRGLFASAGRRQQHPQLRRHNRPDHTSSTTKRNAQKAFLLFLVVFLHHVEKQELSMEDLRNSTATAQRNLVQQSRELFGKASTGVRSTWDKVPTWNTSATSSVSAILTADQFSTLTSWTKELMKMGQQGDDKESVLSMSGTWNNLRGGASQLSTVTTRILSETTESTISLSQKALALVVNSTTTPLLNMIGTTHNGTKQVLKQVGSASKAVLSFQVHALDVAASLVVSSSQQFLALLPNRSSMAMAVRTPRFESLPSSLDLLLPRQLRGLPSSLHPSSMDTPTIDNLSRAHSQALWKAATQHSKQVLHDITTSTSKHHSHRQNHHQSRFRSWVRRIQGANLAEHYATTTTSSAAGDDSSMRTDTSS